MMSLNPEWSIHRNKMPSQEINKELTTARANIINNKTVLRFALGNTICDVLSFNENDRLNIFIHKNDKNLILIKKSNTIYNGIKLTRSKKNKNNRFFYIAFRYPYTNDFRLSQTTVVTHEFNEDKILILDLKNLRWKI